MKIKKFFFCFVSQDTETADKLTNDCEKEQLYRELASTAETGWDFSTRWMRYIIYIFFISQLFPFLSFLLFVFEWISSVSGILLILQRCLQQ